MHLRARTGVYPLCFRLDLVLLLFHSGLQITLQLYLYRGAVHSTELHRSKLQAISMWTEIDLNEFANTFSN